MDRRAFLKLAAGLACATPLLSTCTVGGDSRQKKAKGLESDRPSTPTGLIAKNSNILFISIDDLNDWIEPLGGYSGLVHTPNITRLARMGVTFQRAYCPVPWCAPSRAATIMGLRAETSGYYGQTSDYSQFGRLAERATIPAYLKARGYRTMGGGKILHGDYFYGTGASKAFNPQGQGTRGWDEYLTLEDEPRPVSGPNNDLPIAWSQFDWSSAYEPAETAMPDFKVAEWAALKLKQTSTQPFFLAVGFYRPHLPWYAPKRYFDLYPLSGISIPAHLLQNDLNDLPSFAQSFAVSPNDQAVIDGRDDSNHVHWRQAIQAYLASISFADACVGRLLDALAEGPNAAKTTIVLWSDNGFQLGEKKAWRKFKLWEKSARVPLIIANPGRLNAGRSCYKPVSLIDLFPTLADICTETMPGGVDGQSLRGLLVNPDAAWPRPALTTYSASNDGAQLHRSVRSETHRYIRYFDGSEELYDHRSDPREERNLLWAGYGPNPAARTAADDLARFL